MIFCSEITREDLDIMAKNLVWFIVDTPFFLRYHEPSKWDFLVYENARTVGHYARLILGES